MQNRYTLDFLNLDLILRENDVSVTTLTKIYNQCNISLFLHYNTILLFLFYLLKLLLNSHLILSDLNLPNFVYLEHLARYFRNGEKTTNIYELEAC